MSLDRAHPARSYAHVNALNHEARWKRAVQKSMRRAALESRAPGKDENDRALTILVRDHVGER